MFTTNYEQVDKKISVKTLCWFSKIIVQALIDYNSQHLPELRLLYHNSTRCKWIFSHNLNFLRKKPFIFIKNYTFYFGKYITTYYLLMCRILQFFNMLFFFLNEKIYRKSRCADCRKPFSNTLQEFFLEKMGNQTENYERDDELGIGRIDRKPQLSFPFLFY